MNTTNIQIKHFPDTRIAGFRFQVGTIEFKPEVFESNESIRPDGTEPGEGVTPIWVVYGFGKTLREALFASLNRIEQELNNTSAQ